MNASHQGNEIGMMSYHVQRRISNRRRNTARENESNKGSAKHRSHLNKIWSEEIANAESKKELQMSIVETPRQQPKQSQSKYFSSVHQNMCLDTTSFVQTPHHKGEKTPGGMISKLNYNSSQVQTQRK